MAAAARSPDPECPRRSERYRRACGSRRCNDRAYRRSYSSDFSFRVLAASAWAEFAAATLPRNAADDEDRRPAEARLQDCGERVIMAPPTLTGVMSWRSVAAVCSR